MPQLHGKQLLNKTITQEHLSLETPLSTDLHSGATVEYVNNMASSNIIGPPEYGDQYLDGIYTDFTNLTRTGVVADRFNQLFLKLAPAPPNSFLSSNLSLPITYNARQLNTGNPVVIISNTSPIINVNFATPPGLEGSENGTLTFSVDSNIQETVDVTTTDHKTTGVIRYESGDPYDGVSGKDGFWNSFLSLSVNSNVLIPSSDQKLAELEHSLYGIIDLSFYLDSPITPTITGLVAGIPSMTKWISGVPTLSNTDIISNISFTINNVSSFFYAANYVWQIQQGLVNELLGNPSSIPTTYGESNSITNRTTSIRNNVFSDNSFNFSVRARNSIGEFGPSNTLTDTTKRVDTVSNETIRKTSGNGSYPSTGYGLTFDSTQSLLTSYTNEMMLKNGIYQYPNGDYTSMGGTNYNSITGTRWVTFTTIGTFNDNSAFTLNFIGSNGITSIGQHNLLVEVKISGSTYWVDGDAPYSGVGNPGSTVDGTSSVVIGQSTPTSRRITFGSITYSGQIIVRIGITNNNISFNGITITNIV